MTTELQCVRNELDQRTKTVPQLLFRNMIDNSLTT